MVDRRVRHLGKCWRRLVWLLLLMFAPLFASAPPAKAGGVIPGNCLFGGPPIPCPVFDLQIFLKNIALKIAETFLNQLLQQVSDLWGVVKNEIQVTPTPPTYEILEDVKLPPFQLSDLPCFKQTSTATDPVAQDREDLTLSFVRPPNYRGTTAEEQQLAVCRQLAFAEGAKRASAGAKALQVHLIQLMKKQEDFMKKGCPALVGAANNGTGYCLRAQKNQLRLYEKEIRDVQLKVKEYTNNLRSLQALAQTTNRNLLQ
jgi:hypothetical protein